MIKWTPRYAALAGLLGTVAWMTHSPGWEPAITMLAALSTFVGLDIAAQRSGAHAERRIIADRKLFSRIRALLPYEPVIRFFREHDYGAPFEFSQHQPLYAFRDLCRAPDSRFLMPELKLERKALQDAVESLMTASVNKIFSTEESGWYGIPREWVAPGSSDEFHERFRDAQRVPNAHASQIHDAYDRFVQRGRDLLGVA